MSRLTIVAGVVLVVIAILYAMNVGRTEWVRAALPAAAGATLVGLGATARFGMHRHRFLRWSLAAASVFLALSILDQRIASSTVLAAYWAMSVRWLIRARRKRRLREAMRGRDGARQ